MSEALIIAPRRRPVGGRDVRRLLPFRERRTVGPFIFLDLIGPERLAPGGGIDVDAHPHIGLSTLTYLFAGRLMHRDSIGTEQVITAGAVNWMTAGSGACHTERTPSEDREHAGVLAGVQTWVALPDGAEDMAPMFEHCAAEDVPVLDDGGVEVRLAAGSGFGVTAPIAGSSPLILADVAVDEADLVLPNDVPELGVLAIGGELTLGGLPLPVGSLGVSDSAGGLAVSGRGRALVFGGEPVGQRTIWWNFVHSDPQRIEAAKQRWLDQDFPKVVGDHEVYVPLPGA